MTPKKPVEQVLPNLLNDKHMEILEKAFFRNLEVVEGEYGGIGLNPKRPFGNSDVEGDILKLIGQSMKGDDGDGPCWSSKQRIYAEELYNNLIPWLQKKYLYKRKV